MKLAEALLLRADMQKKIASLRDRIVANAVVQQGDKPHEAPADLMKQVFGVVDDLEKLVIRINQTNMKAKLPDGRTLTESIARRDTLASNHVILQAAIVASRKEPDRYGMREIKWVSTMQVAKLQKQSDDLAKNLRELNAQIQQANWKAELAG